jgi:ATP-dependent RNA helicase DDX23/PRP28
MRSGRESESRSRRTASSTRDDRDSRDAHRSGGCSHRGGREHDAEAPPCKRTTHEGTSTVADEGRSSASSSLPGSTSTAAAQPLSVEAAIAKREAERSEAAKPRFLSREERQRQADEMRRERQRQMQQHKQRLLDQHAEFMSLAYTSSRGDSREDSRDRRDDHDDRWRSRSRYDSRSDSRDARDSRDSRDSREAARNTRMGDEVSGGAVTDKQKEERELEEIRARYLGGVKRKRKLIKPSERFKAANLHWDDDEDTSTNSMMGELPDYRPQFGRGFLGGIDQRLQIESFKLADERDSSKQRRKLESDRERLARLSERDRRGCHWSEKTLAEMSTRDWRIFREDHRITTKGGNIPNPLRTWSESALPPRLLDAVAAAEYTKPSPIQMQAIPIGLQGRDLLGIAETGSGKTAAFVLPMLCYVSAQPRMTAETMRDGPYALILAPTRELVLQIESEAKRFGKATGARTVSIVGGQSIEEQGILLRRGCEIVVATPGRLIDCLEQRYIALNQWCV